MSKARNQMTGATAGDSQGLPPRMLEPRQDGLLQAVGSLQEKGAWRLVLHDSQLLWSGLEAERPEQGGRGGEWSPVRTDRSSGFRDAVM